MRRQIQWTPALEIDMTDGQEAGLPLFVRIARSIAHEIHRGRFGPGDRLPGSRDLAEQLGVNRNTVFAAYQELTAEGWIVGIPKRGTFVSADLPRQPSPHLRVPVEHRDGPGFATRSAPTRASSDTPLQRGTVIMTSGSPDFDTFPVDQLARAYRRALKLGHRQLLGSYRASEGHPKLREAVAEMVSATRGIPASSENILITGGSQMALALLGHALAGAGDVIGVEELGYVPAWEAFEASGATIEPLPIDAHGVRLDAVMDLVARAKLRAIYLTPQRQYPTTVGLAASRRTELLNMASEHRFAIIEDDYDHEFNYGPRPILPLAAMDTEGVVAYVGTLSKVFAPGIRIGYVAAPAPQIRSLAEWRRCANIQGDHVVEAAVAELLIDGEIQRHVNRSRREYGVRHDALVDLVRTHLSHVATTTPPMGGTSLWLDVDPSVDIDRWVSKGREHGVMFRPGSRYSFKGESLPNVRLSFNHGNVDQLAVGVSRMAAALDAS